MKYKLITTGKGVLPPDMLIGHVEANSHEAAIKKAQPYYMWDVVPVEDTSSQPIAYTVRNWNGHSVVTFFSNDKACYNLWLDFAKRFNKQYAYLNRRVYITSEK